MSWKILICVRGHQVVGDLWFRSGNGRRGVATLSARQSFEIFRRTFWERDSAIKQHPSPVSNPTPTSDEQTLDGLLQLNDSSIHTGV